MSRYPKLNIRSKNELAKRISGKGFPYPDALKLISDVITNFDRYWYDSKNSQPEKGKFVRSAVGTPLGKLLHLIDRKVLGSCDFLVPSFVFGGVSGRSHIQAVQHLLGVKRKRLLLGLDISRFFERICEKRVFYFFEAKCGCSKKASRLFAQLCCVPLGPKGSGSSEKSLARGFATSPRLALWCNLDSFLRLSWIVQRKLRTHDPRIAIFVDDIGITASRVSCERMKKISGEVENILANFDLNQKLPVNRAKKKILSSREGMEHLGLRLGRNKLSMGRKVSSKRDRVLSKLKTRLAKKERNHLLKKMRLYRMYQRQVAGMGKK